MCVSVAFGDEVPASFRKLIAYQTPEEWQSSVMSSHADLLVNGPKDSSLIGLSPSEIFELKKILVCMPANAKRGTTPSAEEIFAAYQGYVLVPPEPATRSIDATTDRWVEYKGADDSSYTIEFLGGIPTDLHIRKDANSIFRFGLKKR